MVNPRIQTARQNVKRHREYLGVLGDGNGNPYAGRSRYYVRFPAGTNEDGLTVYTEARKVRYSGESALLAREGVEVLVRRDPYDDVETITRIVPDYAERADFDSKILNSSDTINKWFDVRNFIRLLSRPVGSGLSTSTKVTVRENPYHVDDYGERSTFAGTMPDDQIDLAALIPSTDNHRLVIIFFDFLANAPIAYASTTQSLSSGFDSTDYDECFAQLPHNECIPLVALELANAQTTVSQKDVIEDLRTWLPTPRIYGFPNPIPSGKKLLIRSTHKQMTYNLTVEGGLTVQGGMTVL